MVPALVVLTVALLLRCLFTRSSERDRIVGLLLFFAALVTLAFAVGFGRGGREGNRDGHYSTLALPILCVVYFAWEMYGSRPASRLVEMCLFCVMCAAFILNGPPGRYLGGPNAVAAEIQRDVLAGMSPCGMAERHLLVFWWPDTQEGRRSVADGLAILGRAGVAPFRSLRGDRECIGDYQRGPAVVSDPYVHRPE